MSQNRDMGHPAFQMTPTGAVTLLHSFGGGSDGQDPFGSLVQGTDGNFYGLTESGGANSDGVMFQMTSAGALMLLHSFAGGSSDGLGPQGSLAVTGYASPAILKEGGTVTVTAKYADGNTDPLFTGTVTLTSSDANATLPTAYTFTSADAGVHSFNVALNTRGTQSITATSGSVSGSQTAIMVGDAIWVLSSAGTLAKLNVGGAAVGSGVGTGGSAASVGGAAFDSVGDIWSVSSAANTLTFATSLGAGAASETGGGLNAPVSVAVDGAGMIWIANSGGNTVSEFRNSGTAVTSSNGYGSSDNLNAPSSVAIDKAGGVWVANKTGGSVTHIFGAATPVVTPLSSATTNGALGTKP